ncbi:MAG: hypothetical protein L0Y72_08380 [Gemmataceae bacterium]|nr:hypothetical protein [Gemmataceae bacterium]MCI0739046.1 hypothetical protein [Gemmataceae bacterium]
MHRCMGGLGAVLSVAFLGCGGGRPAVEIPRLFPVSGIVLQKNGKPYTGAGLISFEHLQKGEFSATGTIQPDGAFLLMTSVGNSREPGAMEGVHTVTIVPASEDQDVQPIVLKKRYLVEKCPNEITVTLE